MRGKAEGGVFQVRLSPPLWQALHAERGTETRSASGRALLLLGLQAIGYDMHALLPDIVDACQDDLSPALHHHLMLVQNRLLGTATSQRGGAPVQEDSRSIQPPAPPPAPPLFGGSNDPYDIGEEF